MTENVPLRLLDSDPSEAAAVYLCPQCGHVDLFARMPLDEEPPE